MTNNKPNQNIAVLHAAWQAWMAAATLRQARQRNKRFTYGDQWSDVVTTCNHERITEHENCVRNGSMPLTNNVLRQIVKTIVGRYRATHLHTQQEQGGSQVPTSLDELDSRMLEEFLISGCCVQRIDEPAHPLAGACPQVAAVPLGHFFINPTADALGRDCELIGQLHDLSVAELLQRTAGGNRQRAAAIRALYSEQAVARTAQLCASLGCDQIAGTDFWHPRNGNRCRAIEVWTLESREALTCHDRATGRWFTAPLAKGHKLKANPNITARWDVVTAWHCRWFSPMGDLLCEHDSPHGHKSHPFVTKFYPMVDGEVHGFIEDVIDQQKMLNRLVTVIVQSMRTSAKGVLLFPHGSVPPGWTWHDVQRSWSSSNGVIPYIQDMGGGKPEQITTNNTNFGAYEMIALQLRLLEQISGVSGALQGREVDTGGSAALYQSQAQNAAIALTDVFDTFTHFRSERDRKLAQL